MARRTAQDKWAEAVASALKLSHALYPQQLGRISALNLPAVTPETDAKTALRIAQQVFQQTPEEAAAWSEANALYWPMQHGLNRKERRRPTSEWKASNDPLIKLLLTAFPNLLTEPVTKQRITAIQKWLAEKRKACAPIPPPPHLRPRTPDGLRKAIRRARP